MACVLLDNSVGIFGTYKLNVFTWLELLLLSRFLVEIISPLTGKSSSYVKNSAHFVERISDACIHSNQMVSLDVENLFTKVPTDETLAVVRDKLAADLLLEECTCIPIDNLMEILTFCVETTYFRMGSNIYHQEEGLAMGSPITWSRELNPTIYTVHYGEGARQQITLPRCNSNMHWTRNHVICVP